MDLPVNKTIAYALRRFAGCVTRRNAYQLTGVRGVNMVELKRQIMAMADAVEGSAGEISLPVNGGDPTNGGQG
jgi:hypothetical protein